jgi:hypothetical protein
VERRRLLASRIVTSREESRWRRVLPGLGLVVIAGVLAVTTARTSAPQSVEATGTLRFGDRVTVPSRGEPVVVSLQLDNAGSAAVQVASLTPASTDDLEVEYAGHSFCRQVCPGGVTYDAAVAGRVRELVSDQGPLLVPPSREVAAGRAESLWLIFIVRPISSWGPQEVCRLAPPPTATIAGGATQEVRFPDGTWVLGVTKKGTGEPHCGS